MVFDSLKTDSIVSSVVIRDIQIGRAPYVDLRNIPMDGRVIKLVHLAYNENNLTIYCATLRYNNGDSLMFSWKPEGHNQGHWQGRSYPYHYKYRYNGMLQDGQQIREIVTYCNLSPGRYIFRARVMKLRGK